VRTLDVAWIAICVALTASTIHFWRDRNAERHRADAFEARSMSPESVSFPVATSVAGPAPTPTATSASPIPDAVRTPHVPTDLRLASADQRLLLQDPSYREAWRANRRLRHENRFMEMRRVLGLSSESTDALLEITLDHEMEGDMYPGAFPPATEAESQAFVAYQAGLLQSRERREREVLGDADYDRLVNFREGIATRNQLKEFRAQLAETREPLEPDQYDRLVVVMMQERAKLNASLRDLFTEGQSDGSVQALKEFQSRAEEVRAAGYRHMSDAARPLLSSAQLTALEATFALERNEARTRDSMNLSAAKVLDATASAAPR
jgi:hypothetical protein